MSLKSIFSFFYILIILFSNIAHKIFQQTSNIIIKRTKLHFFIQQVKFMFYKASNIQIFRIIEKYVKLSELFWKNKCVYWRNFPYIFSTVFWFIKEILKKVTIFENLACVIQWRSVRGCGIILQAELLYITFCLIKKYSVQRLNKAKSII